MEALWVQLNAWIVDNGSKDFINLSGFLITTISSILAIVFYFKGKKEKIPIYAIRTNNLIRGYGKEYSRLTVSYGGEEVENLSVAKVIFWNSGRETIRNTDIPNGDRVRIEAATDFRILDAKILGTSHPSNGANLVEASEKKIMLEFEYFDFDEGVVIQVIHTGTSEDDIKVLGKLVGAKRIAKIETPILSKIKLFSAKRLMIRDSRSNRLIMGIVTLIVTITIITRALGIQIDGSPKAVWYIRIIYVFFAYVYLNITYFLLRKHMPRNLEKFAEIQNK